MSVEWPPPFDSDGAAYIFDARSGFFYEGASDFFYDPKNKLYYGNKKKAYFQHVPGGTPEFQPIAHPQPEGSTIDGAGVSADSNNNSNSNSNNSHPDSMESLTSSSILEQKTTNGGPTSNENTDGTKNDPTSQGQNQNQNCGKTPNKTDSNNNNKMKIAISINQSKKVASVVNHITSVIPVTKTKPVIHQSTHNNNNNSQPTPSLTQKKHSADIDKWAERGREIRNILTSSEGTSNVNIGGGGGGVESHHINNDAPSQCQKKCWTLLSKSIFGKTTAGNPVCLLCQRKFQNVEKLKQHVKLSLLHKHNLAKREAALEKAALAKEQEKEYRDRAQERRFLYGPEAPSSSFTKDVVDDESMSMSMGMSMGMTTGPSLTQARVVTTAEVVNPSENLGDSNIGNKLLQKLGWKNGASLGRKEKSDGSASNSNNSEGGGNMDNAKDHLRKDWEKIESMAGGGGGVKQGEGGGIGHTSAFRR